MTVAIRSTYRVQLHPGFGFTGAAGVLDHVHRLGISHLYTSPVLEATSGSTHGYDVTDHTTVRHALGGDEGLRTLVQELRARGMGWVVDIVPNHVSVAVPRENPRWWDVLGHGPTASSTHWFDVDWDRGDGRVVLPVLGAPLDDEIDAGTVELRTDADGQVVVGYHDLEVPVAEGTATPADIGATGAALREVLDAQHHRLSWWRAGDRNYRVFFDIDSLAALRIEDDDVFAGVHARLADWVEDDLVDGVRVDHVDGLADPTGYLARLRDLIGEQRRLWVEKILMVGETLPAAWAVDGTTGYEFARLATAVSIEPSARGAFEAEWVARSGSADDYHRVEEAAKRAAVTERLGPDLDRVRDAAGAAGLAVGAPGFSDALVELVVAFPAYRSYGVGTEPLSPIDAALLDRAAAATRSRLGESDHVDAIHRLLLEPADAAGALVRQRFQQLSSPAMAKGAEDTAFYRYHRFVALNEVGGAPGSFGADPAELHDHNAEMAGTHPATMLAASTHDTKRSADVRARLAVVSHDPDRWRATVRRWSSKAEAWRPHRLDSATEYLAWQTVLGAWPIDAGRLGAYLRKAAKEAKEATSWTDPDADYERALTEFAERLLEDPELVADIAVEVEHVAPSGRAVRVGEVVLRCTSPGVPDTYQGDQDWDLSLVDPDNRRAVDHEAIHLRLGAAIEMSDVDRCGLEEGSLAKLWVLHRLGALRAQRPELFVGAGYEPLAGPAGVVAFRRGELVTVADMRPGRSAGDSSVELPDGSWRDVLRTARTVDGGTRPLADVVGPVPVAVFVRA